MLPAAESLMRAKADYFRRRELNELASENVSRVQRHAAYQIF